VQTPQWRTAVDEVPGARGAGDGHRARVAAGVAQAGEVVGLPSIAREFGGEEGGPEAVCACSAHASTLSRTGEGRA